ncbi:hypothetical protein LMH73_018460 [Vibrio splendidus]|nr:hypothetical protein [Vibrio splendidus]MCC4880330.1 hypothetical protein [Vibrio splendidus]
MFNLPSIEEIESKEDSLADMIRILSHEQREAYYTRLASEVKDPDTYASLNYFFILGLHHLYLGKSETFAVETSALLFSIMLISTDITALGIMGAISLIAIAGYQMSQLFLSQRMVRKHNYETSISIYLDILKSSK